MSSSIWWEPDDGSDLPTHEEVFSVLDQLASADDGLGTLAALAAVLDVTDGVCDVSSQLRAVAERAVDPSEARLFSGYVNPESAAQSDASAMAGRMLRAHRDRDLDAMVEAANLNPRLFVECQYVGVLTIAPVLAYEISRYSTATPVSERVSEFFDVCPIPMAGAEDLLDRIAAGMVGWQVKELGAAESLSDEDAEMLVGMGEMVLENRPVVDRFLLWALGVAGEVRRARPSRSLDQCGATLTSHFGPKVGELAVRVSEDPSTRRFRHEKVPTGSSYGDWLRWLELLSPKGFTHRTMGSFTPEDLVMAKEMVEFRGEVVQVVNALQSSGGPAVWSSGAQFWSLANDLYSKDQGERLFPIIGIGMTGGAAAGSYLSKLLFDSGMGPYTLMQVAAGLLLAHLLLTMWANAVWSAQGEQEDEPMSGGNGFLLVLTRPYIRLIAVLLILLNLVNTTGEYLLGELVIEAANVATDGSEDAVGAWIGSFYGDFFFWVNIAAVTMQALLVSRLVKWFGITAIVFMLPIVALGVYGGLAAGAGFVLFRWLKTAENSTDYSVMNTAKGMLWLPTSRDEKYKAKQAVDTFFVRLGDMISAGLVFVGTNYLALGTRGFASVNLGIIVLWLLVSWRVVVWYKRLAKEQGIDTKEQAA